MRLRLKNLLVQERGVALVLALGIMTVLGITFITVIDYTTSNSRTTHYSRSRLSAFGLAEAGMNDAMAILNKPTNNALDPDILPSTTKTYENGSVTWSGVLDRNNAIWTV